MIICLKKDPLLFLEHGIYNSHRGCWRINSKWLDEIDYAIIVALGTGEILQIYDNLIWHVFHELPNAIQLDFPRHDKNGRPTDSTGKKVFEGKPTKNEDYRRLIGRCLNLQAPALYGQQIVRLIHHNEDIEELLL